MGCNYYGKRILTVEEKLEIIDAVINDKPLNIPSIYIHIGKYSDGWRFLFNHHNWQYFKDREELYAFLKKYNIVDQYGTEVSFEDFWRLVTTSRNEGINKDDIIKFGLRFSDSTHFS